MPYDEDPNVRVYLSGDDDPYCVLVYIGDDLTLHLHVRSAVDLSQKLNKAALDWIGGQVRKSIEREGL